MIIADKISGLRKKRGISQEELAEQMNVSRQSVSKWESGSSVPDLNKIIQLARIFGVSTDFLLLDELEDESFGEGPKTDDITTISIENANEFIEDRRAFGKKIALGVVLFILSPISLFIALGWSEKPGSNLSEDMGTIYGLIPTLIIVAIGVLIVITASGHMKKYKFIEEVNFEIGYGVEGLIRNKREEYRKTYYRRIALGVILCILSVIPLIVTSILYDDWITMVALSFLLLMVSIAVYNFIVASTRHDSYEILLKEGDYTKESFDNSKKEGTISAIYWSLLLSIYFGYSFITYDWGSSWIVWPVGAVLFPIITNIFRLFRNKSTN